MTDEFHKFNALHIYLQSGTSRLHELSPMDDLNKFLGFHLTSMPNWILIFQGAVSVKDPSFLFVNCVHLKMITIPFCLSTPTKGNNDLWDSH
jgi:hypothetical protein